MQFTHPPRQRFFRLLVAALTSPSVLAIGGIVRADDATLSAEVSPAPIKVSPAAEPVPALRYRFWPESRQMQPSSGEVIFTRAMMMIKDIDAGAESNPADDLSDQLRQGQWSDRIAERCDKLVLRYQSPIAEMDRAVDCGGSIGTLNLNDLTAEQRVMVLLPEVQVSRQMTRVYLIQGFAQAHRGDWRGFNRTCQSLFRLADYAGKPHYFLVGRLVRFAIVAASLEMIEQVSKLRDCPNFYWALAAVPDSMFEMDSAIEVERELSLILFGNDALPDQPIGRQAASRRIVDTARRIAELLKLTSVDVREKVSLDQIQITTGLYVVSAAPACRDALRSHPQWSDRVDELSDAEAVLRAVTFDTRVRSDRFYRWSLLPSEIRKTFLDNADSELEQVSLQTPFLPAVVSTDVLLPALNAAYAAEVRLKQQIRDAVNLQAVRAAAAAGAMPESADDFVLPLWPMTLAMGPEDRLYRRVSDRSVLMLQADTMNSGQTVPREIRMLE